MSNGGERERSYFNIPEIPQAISRAITTPTAKVIKILFEPETEPTPAPTIPDKAAVQNMDFLVSINLDS